MLWEYGGWWYGRDGGGVLLWGRVLLLLGCSRGAVVTKAPFLFVGAAAAFACGKMGMNLVDLKACDVMYTRPSWLYVVKEQYPCELLFPLR